MSPDHDAIDLGGTVFDLQKISQARFNLPVGGQSGAMERLSAADPEVPLVLTADWADARRRFSQPIRLSFRYRMRVDALGPSERVAIKVKFYSRGKNGTRQTGQPDWSVKAYDTGGRWRACTFTGLNVKEGVDDVDFIFSLCEGLGRVEVKDFVLSQGTMDPAAAPEHLVRLRNATMSLLDGCFAIGSGQPQMLMFEWCDNGSHTFDRGKWRLRLDLPKGLRCLAVPAALKGTDRITTNADGTQTITFRPMSQYVALWPTTAATIRT